MSTITRRLSMIAIITALLLMAVQPLFAQTQNPITASVDRTTLSTDETLILSVAVTSGQGSHAQVATEPQLSDLDGFSIVGQTSSTNISIVNGEFSTSMVYSYRLQPNRTGTLIIGPVQYSESGQIYATAPIVVEVSQGSGLPQQRSPGLASSLLAVPSQLEGQGMFVEAFVDNPQPFVGEQIVYTFRLFEPLDTRRLPGLFSSQPSYAAPPMTGFWTEGETEQSNYQVSNDGRIYAVTELRTNIFPTTPGEVTIEAARLTMPGSVFQPGGVLATEPFSVNVKALPAGAPANFGGAVGQYEIGVALDTMQSKVDEPITLRVTLSGSGNVSTVADPIWPQMDGWRAFDAESTVETTVREGRVVGTRTYDWLLIPTVEGEQTIPAIEYSYFDPADSQYHTVATQPVAISIAPGTGQSSGSATALAATVVEPADESEPMQLKEDGATLTPVAPSLPQQPWYWFLWTVPLAGLLGSFTWRRRQSYLRRNAVWLRSSRAHKQAQAALRKIQHSNDAEEERCAAVHHVLIDYLQAKLNRPISGLASRELAQELRSRGIEADLAEEMAACYQHSEQSRFVPGGVSELHVKTTIECATETISALEAALPSGEIVS